MYNNILWVYNGIVGMIVEISRVQMYDWVLVGSGSLDQKSRLLVLARLESDRDGIDRTLADHPDPHSNPNCPDHPKPHSTVPKGTLKKP